MKSKIVKNYTYTGFIFPVELEKVEMVYYGKEWCPKIDIRKLASQVIEMLAYKNARLTGDEVRFIRAHYGMSLRDFAKQVAHETHAAVKKWEDKHDQPTRMNPNTELVIRNYIIEQALSKEEKQAVFYNKTVDARSFLTSSNDTTPTYQINYCA